MRIKNRYYCDLCGKRIDKMIVLFSEKGVSIDEVTGMSADYTVDCGLHLCDECIKKNLFRISKAVRGASLYRREGETHLGKRREKYLSGGELYFLSAGGDLLGYTKKRDGTGWRKD